MTFITCPKCKQTIDHNDVLKHMSGHGDEVAKALIESMNLLKEIAHLEHYEVKDLVTDEDVKKVQQEAELLDAGIVDSRDDDTKRMQVDNIQHIIINRTKRKVMLFLKPKGVIIIDYKRVRFIPEGQAAFVHDDPPP